MGIPNNIEMGLILVVTVVIFVVLPIILVVWLFKKFRNKYLK